MKIDARWEGLDELVKSLGAVPAEAEHGLARAVQSSTTSTQESVWRAAPRRPGGSHQVAAGVRSRVSGSGADTEGRVYLTGAAIPVATGSRAHLIAPKRRRALAFGDRFAAHVKHPGNPPNDFFDRGVRAAAPSIDAALEKVGEDILRVIR